MVFFFSSRRRHTRCSRDWSSDVCSSDLSLGRRFVIFNLQDADSASLGWLEIEAEAELRGERRPRGIVGVIAAGILAAERGVLQLPEGGGRREDISRRRIDAQAVVRRRLERARCARLINDIGGVEQVEEVGRYR